MNGGRAMPTVDELQKQHEAKLDGVLREIGGRSRDSDWALVRALIHTAVHFNADRKAGEFCAIATFLAEQTGHAHRLLHRGDSPTATHDDFMH
jgi:hypothetical protein